MVTCYNCLQYYPQELWNDREIMQCFQCGTELRHYYVRIRDE